jgi:hypothetical protein
MPITFPANPQLNDTTTQGGKTWVWDGERWMPSIVSNVGLSGSGIYNIDGGLPNSVYGGLTGIDGGGVA